MLSTENGSTAEAKSPNDAVHVKVDYSRALRAIGQDLTHLFPKILIIETDGVNFTARGKSHPNPFHRVKSSTLKNVWHTLTGKVPGAEPRVQEPSTDDFQRSYTPADIDRMDQLYSANRNGRLERPESYSLAERLRAMGQIVKSRNGRLQRLRKDADSLFADYWDQNGDLRTAKLTTVILYRNQEQPAGSLPKELWEGYDF
jgi:hypothetical protein